MEIITPQVLFMRGQAITQYSTHIILQENILLKFMEKQFITFNIEKI
jgi:hypothetical protein